MVATQLARSLEPGRRACQTAYGVVSFGKNSATPPLAGAGRAVAWRFPLLVRCLGLCADETDSPRRSRLERFGVMLRASQGRQGYRRSAYSLNDVTREHSEGRLANHAFAVAALTGPRAG